MSFDNEMIEIENGRDRKTTILTGSIVGIDEHGFLICKTIFNETKKFLKERVIIRTINKERVDDEDYI